MVSYIDEVLVAQLSREIMIVCEEQGKILWADQRAAHLLSVRPEMTFEDLVISDDVEKARQLLSKAGTTSVRDCALTLFAGKELLTVAFSAGPIADGILLVGSQVSGGYEDIVSELSRMVSEVTTLHRETARQERQLREQQALLRRSEERAWQMAELAESTRKRAELLSHASRQLGNMFDYQVACNNIAAMMVPAFADYCAICVIERGGEVQRIAVEQIEGFELQLARHLARRTTASQPPLTGTENLRSSPSSLSAEVQERLWQSLGLSRASLMTLRQQGRSTLLLPLEVHGQLLGALILAVVDAERSLAGDDVTMAEDLAQRIASAIEISRLYGQAQEAVRVRDAFFSVAAHELKNPLTSLLGNAQLLHRRATRQTTLTDRDQWALAVIVEQASRLNKMIGTLLDVARIERGELGIVPRPLDLGALACQVVEELRSSSGQHTLTCSVADEPLVVNGDEVRLAQVLHNLISNAIKYSPQGGAVTVTVERHMDLVCIQVTDQGLGIPEAALPNLFRRFYRADNVAEQHLSGMGIGLYVVKEIVTLHGGSVVVESIEGEGSNFRVYLPLLEQAKQVFQDLP